jgi:hypothetical protein
MGSPFGFSSAPQIPNLDNRGKIETKTIAQFTFLLTQPIWDLNLQGELP